MRSGIDWVRKTADQYGFTHPRLQQRGSIISHLENDLQN